MPAPAAARVRGIGAAAASLPAYMGDCQNYGPFLGPHYTTGPNLGDPKKGS